MTGQKSSSSSKPSLDLSKIKPTDDRMLVRLEEQKKQTESGILIPETADRERPQMGEVLAVGPGKLLETGSRAHMSIKVGDRVLFSKYGPTEVKVQNEELFFLREEDVLAVLS